MPFHFWHFLRITSFYILAKWVMSKQYSTHELFPWICFSAALPPRRYLHNLGDNGVANLPAHARAYWSFQSGSRVHQCAKYPPTKTSLIWVAIRYCGRGGSGSDGTSGTLLGWTNTSKDLNRYLSSGQAGPAVSFGLCGLRMVGISIHNNTTAERVSLQISAWNWALCSLAQ